MVPRIPALQGDAMRRHIVAFGAEYAGGSTRRQSRNLTHGSDCGGAPPPSDAESAGRLGWESRDRPARRHGESGGGPCLQGELNSSFPRPPSSPSLRPASFQSGNSLSNSHADGLNGSQKTCLLSKDMRSSTLHKGSDIAITQ